MTQEELMIRATVSAVLGMIIGIERSWLRKPASIRTFSFISLGSCIFTALSMIDIGGNTDPTRIAAQVVSGVGFIGAGVIIKDTTNKDKIIEGITTASMMWFVASLGMVCGFGLYLCAAYITILYILVTKSGILLHIIVDILRERIKRQSITKCQ